MFINKQTKPYMNPTVDGQNLANQFDMINICNYPISSKGFSTIPGGKVWDVQGKIPPSRLDTIQLGRQIATTWRCGEAFQVVGG